VSITLQGIAGKTNPSFLTVRTPVISKIPIFVDEPNKQPLAS